MQVLQYAVRPSRPPNTPRIRGLYVFGPKDPPIISKVRRHVNHYPAGIAPLDTMPSFGVMSSQGAQIGAQWNQKSEDALSKALLEEEEKWYRKSGKIILKPPIADWAMTMQMCRGLISFDAVLCSGPRHEINAAPADISQDLRPWYRQPEAHLPPSVATFALDGCRDCHRAPEGLSIYGQSPIDTLPLLAPLPLHTSTIKAATKPSSAWDGKEARLLARCEDCVRNRYCENCQNFWCEDCFAGNYGRAKLLASRPENVLALPEDDRAVVRETEFKVHMSLCIEDCLVGEMMSGAGSNGMWG